MHSIADHGDFKHWRSRPHEGCRGLREGKLVAIPTETVYGLGANAFDEVAVARIFEAKARPTFDPLIVHIADIEDIGLVAREVSQPARTLARELWPGPLTIILPKRPEVPDIVTAGLPTVAVRCPKHSIAQRIIELAGVPVAAPSANPFGYISPTTAAHVVAMLKDRVDFVVDGGPCDVGVESTVIDMTGARPMLFTARWHGARDYRGGHRTGDGAEAHRTPCRGAALEPGPIFAPLCAFDTALPVRDGRIGEIPS